MCMVAIHIMLLTQHPKLFECALSITTQSESFRPLMRKSGHAEKDALTEQTFLIVTASTSLFEREFGILANKE